MLFLRAIVHTDAQNALVRPLHPRAVFGRLVAEYAE
jgi:hypothetical protein